jgi:threonine dehydrogenase-like Zn-dependent dehydrogenase
MGDTAAVFGAGPIGLLTVACLKLAGAGRVIAVEPVAERRDLAKAVGADDVVDPNQVDPRIAVREATGRGGVNVAIDCVTRDGTLDHCIHVTRKCGRVVVTGIPSDPRVTLDFHVMRRNEIHLFNVRRSNHETEAAVELMKARPDVLQPIVTHARPIEEIQGAFEQLEAYAGGVGKIVLRLD